MLPEALAKDYIRSDFYTLGQITAAIKNHGLSSRYEPYAVALFTSFEGIGTIFQFEYSNINGYKIRAEVADLLFDGNMHYVIAKSLKLSEYGNNGIDPMPGGTLIP